MSSPLLMNKALSDFSRLLVAIKDFKDDDLVRLDEDGRTIKKNTDDRIHPFFGYRSEEKRAVNNDVRAFFMEKLEKCFAGNPEGLAKIKAMKEMKMEDYGKGRPLSARRIKAVAAAVAAETGAIVRQDGVMTLSPDDQKPVKVRMTPAESAKSSCSIYIDLLAMQRDSLLTAIRKSGFSSQGDEWIVKGLRDYYDRAMQNAKKILNDGNMDAIKNLFGLDDDAFGKMQEPLSDDKLMSKIFNDSKSVLSKTLCSLALLSEYEFGEDDNAEERSASLAKELSDAFELYSFDDFGMKLDRVKALIRPEGAEKTSSVLTIYSNLRDTEYAEDADVVKKSNADDFLRSDAFKDKLANYMKGRTSFTAKDVQTVAGDYLDQVEDQVWKKRTALA